MPIMDQSFRMSEKEIEKRHEKERKKQEKFLRKHTQDDLEYCPECGIPTPHIYRKGYYAASASMKKCTKCGRNEEISIPDFMKL